MLPNFTSSETFTNEVQTQIPESGRCPTTGVLFESEVDMLDGGLAENTVITRRAEKRKLELVWRNIILFSFLHLGAVYGAWLLVTSAKWLTSTLVFSLFFITGFGVTGGAHRLWAHRTYKAKWPLKLILVIVNSMAFQDSIFCWARDHRVHHKYSETDADPHNATRGFFFSHVGWLLCKKHPDVLAKGKLIDLSDLKADPFVAFQHRYYNPLMLSLCFVVPTLIPMYFWNETLLNSFFIWAIFRWCYTLNATWCVNSAAHAFGYRSYDKSIRPSENLTLSIVTFGEGWHNYHHVFPWDYKASEWGASVLNTTTLVINLFAKIGWAYDLKTVSRDVIERRVKRTGDGSHNVWGWGDKDLTKSDKDEVLIINKKV
ncbi:acyl-CoA Delta-9 desaturase-like, partial [Eupeodes corollae]|uniref:acyl-CoA Delta-9 desaturase-like n=1 Tax=Eupeodes corollae TaxID=290404 RepID=UPI00248F989C